MFLSQRSKESDKSIQLDDNSLLDETDVDVDDVEVDDDVDVDVEVNMDDTQKRHFLDYDAVPPPEFEANFERTLNLSVGPATTTTSNASNSSINEQSKHSATAGEQLKMDKKYERDGEVSDYELAACGYTKKEFTQDDNTLHLSSAAGMGVAVTAAAVTKPKHFLDENPIPPDYMLQKSIGADSEHAASLIKEPSYTLSRFLDSDTPYVGESAPSLPSAYRLPRSLDSRYSSLQLSLPPSVSSTVGESDNLGSKVECVYSLLSMLGSNDPLEMSKKFLELSRSAETCATLRRSGCIPLLVQMVYSESEEHVRKCANAALHNVVHGAHAEDKVAARREGKVLRLLDQIVDYCNFLKTLLQSGGEAIADDSERHPLAAISSLMKVSFDEEHRHAMVELGALHAIPNLVQLDHAVHGPKPEDQCCNSLRRYALMALTNLTFGDEHNKALLCSQKTFMEALVAQLDSAPDDLLQVTASVLRNLSWRADNNMKAVLNEIGTVTALARAAMKNKSENTLKAILSALWNLSAHCSTNKAEFCAVEGALAFLVDMLSYEGPSKTLKIIENAGGILRNVSSHIAVREHYRQILRERNCLSILLQQLKSESLTVVSNSCGTLWNLSARCPEDQKYLWDNGAVPMLRSLIHSKHTMISEGSASALKNLLNFRPTLQHSNQMDAIARSMGLKQLPTLNVRKQKALAQELGEQKLSETCDNIDTMHKGNETKELTRSRLLPLAAVGVVAPTNNMRLTRSAMLTKSESRDSVYSAKSDTAYEHLMRSHSASDANRTTKAKYAPFATRAAFVNLNNEVEEPTEEQPVNYSAKYAENSNKRKHIKQESSIVSAEQQQQQQQPQCREETQTVVHGATYQETDLDQLTDFSLRYAENQIESDVDITTPEAEAQKVSNEILLILEDTVKCYQTEDTPYVISNAASVTDLRQASATTTTTTTTTASKSNAANANAAITSAEQLKKAPASKKHVARHLTHIAVNSSNVIYGSGTYTPEKPINYCEEGTPGYFSRYESLSSLDESTAALKKEETEKKLLDMASNTTNAAAAVAETSIAVTTNALKKEDVAQKSQAQSMLNSAQETPLMFSRHSSMDSLVEADVGPLDDKSSVISDSSRLASGVISPSEIPDSPTQSMPQSPRRRSAYLPAAVIANNAKPLRSVFEDDLNRFHVENTPAQFSTATSLSNLSIVDDEQAVVTDTSKHALTTTSSIAITAGNIKLTKTVADVDELEDEADEDGLLLANCINMGMKRSNAANNNNNKTILTKSHVEEETKRYCTEDTPALLSKMGSNTNLSVISICSSDYKNNASAAKITSSNVEATVKAAETTITAAKRDSMNLSDDVSSNASESGNAADILQQCIREGMQKVPTKTANPINMLRCGAAEPLSLPAYLPVSDEIGKYLVEDSPCRFSIMSGLSNLTVGSSLVGPAVQLKSTDSIENKTKATSEAAPNIAANKENVRNAKLELRQRPQWHDDSLSSLSIDSEDDTNLLSQAIAAGCNRPKSNLGFCTSSSSSKRSTVAALSASQPLPINAAVAAGTSISATSLNTATTTTRRQHKQRHRQQQLHQHQQLQQQQQQQHSRRHMNGNESYSSVDSTDSNDNQSKSLLELCILSGMHNTTRDTHSKRSIPTAHSSSRSRSAAYGVAVGATALDMQAMSNKQQQQQQTHAQMPNRHLRDRDRERKDEKLLLECINTGITKKISKDASQLKVQQTQQQHTSAMLLPKNVQATSAAVLVPIQPMAATTYKNVHSTAAATGVEKNYNNSNNSNNNNSVQQQLMYYNNSSSNINHADIIIDAANAQAATAIATTINAIQNPENVQMTMNAIGCEVVREQTCSPDETHTSSDESNISFIMEPTTATVNSTLTTQALSKSEHMLREKHRDPDLMLKSVERLTLEFVTSAEQLRDSNYSKQRNQTGTNSNNTWNEHSCPNDVSFPSLSLTAPVISSLHDSELDDDDEQATEAEHKDLCDFAENSPTNEREEQKQQQQQVLPNYLPEQLHSLDSNQTSSLDLDTPTLVGMPEPNIGSAVLNFQLGGEVQTAAAQATRQLSYNSNMSNSTMFAIEARALAANLQYVESETLNDSTELTFSINSLDLDNVRPPSGMESLNISGYYQDMQPGSLKLASKSPRMPRKALPAGLVARRALGQLTGSVESVNSSCNLLDNIRPPSLMDDLLDSMISVASIQSEVADCASLATTVSLSHYETADLDDNTITLQSCLAEQLPNDAPAEADNSDSASTPLPSDHSSATSTPKRNGVKRTLTPKQKRKLAQDRFKTYTIAADLVLTEERQRLLELTQQAQEDEDEVLQIEIIDSETNAEQQVTPRKPFNRRRSESQDRYKTQTIVYAAALPQVNNECNSLNSTDDDPASEEISSIRALTARFQYIQAADVNIDMAAAATNGFLTEQLLDETQNSDTESCHADADDVEEDEEHETCAIGARIVSNIVTADNNKGVRGRKKIAYVSPYSKQAQRQATTTPRLATNKPIKTMGIQTKRLQKPTTAVVAVAIERQGTFVQEEPTVKSAAVPVVETATATQRASKLPTKRVTNTNANKSQMARRIQTTTTTTLTKTTFSSISTTTTTTNRTQPKFRTTATAQRSNSNANIRLTSNSARLAMVSARGVTTTPPSRSNSNLNSASNSNSNLKIQQAQSRIASIWKRVDEVKRKPAATTTAKAASKTTTTTNAQRLERSSTFDNSAEETKQQQQQQQQQTVRAKKPTAATATTPKIPMQSKIAVNRSNLAITRRNI